MVAQRTEPMERSAHADAIYEADLFAIDGRIWMIGGSGKSQAATLASCGDPSADIARDSIGIIRNGDRLYGRFDPGALPIDPGEREQRHRIVKLDAIAYCMSAAETVHAYSSRPCEITPVDAKMLGGMLSSSIYPARWAPFYFEPGEMARLLNRKLRLQRFLQLTEGIVDTRFLVLPWMPRVEAKAALYVNFAWPERSGVSRGTIAV
jgi:hypothetical protein